MFLGYLYPMPRKPTKIHVVRTARTIWGLKQKQLAQQAGVGVETIKRIENGSLKPSKDLALRLAAILAIDPEQIRENFDAETPYLFMGHPEVLTKEAVKARRKKKLDEAALETVERQVEIAANSIRQMLLANVPKSSSPGVWLAVCQALQKVREEFNLPVVVQRAFLEQAAKRQRPPQASPGCGSGERKSLNPQRVPSVRQSRQRA